MAIIRALDPFRRHLFKLFFWVVLVGTSGCERTTPPSQNTAIDSAAVALPKPVERPVVILYSYSPIGTELKQMAQVQSDTIWAGREIVYANAPHPVVLANSGVGLANAAATTQYLIDRYDPTAIIFTGIASAVNPAHMIGDLVIPERYITFDYGYWGDQGFSTDSVSVGRSDSAGFDRMLEIPVDRDLYDALGQAANDAAYLLRIVGRRLPEIHQGGVAISGNAFLDQKAKRDQLYKQLKAQITDTESAAVVQTAYAAGVPVAVMRACAAPAGESATPQAQALLSDFFKTAAHNVALVLQQFLAPAEQ